MELNNIFPRQSGLYIAQKGKDVVLIKLTGMYPTLKLGKALALDKLIESNSLKEADKSLLNHMTLFPEEWTFQPLPTINMTAFPKTAFQPNSGTLSLEYDEYIAMKNKYFRMLQCGCTIPQVTDALTQEFKISLEKVNNLIDRFNVDK